MVAVSYLVYPVQIALFVLFVRLGEGLLGVAHSGLTWEIVKASFQQNLWETLHGFSGTLVYATPGWLFVSLPLGAILYKIALTLLRTQSQAAKEKLGGSLIEGGMPPGGYPPALPCMGFFLCCSISLNKYFFE